MYWPRRHWWHGRRQENAPDVGKRVHERAPRVRGVMVGLVHNQKVKAASSGVDVLRLNVGHPANPKFSVRVGPVMMSDVCPSMCDMSVAAVEPPLMGSLAR